MSSDWICGVCFDINFARNKTCRWGCDTINPTLPEDEVNALEQGIGVENAEWEQQAQPQGGGFGGGKDFGGGGKDSGGGDRPRGRGGPTVIPGDWICPGCGDLQFARNYSCRICSTPKPPNAGMEDLSAKGKGKGGKDKGKDKGKGGKKGGGFNDFGKGKKDFGGGYGGGNGVYGQDPFGAPPQQQQFQPPQQQFQPPPQQFQQPPGGMPPPQQFDAQQFQAPPPAQAMPWVPDMLGNGGMWWNGAPPPAVKTEADTGSFSRNVLSQIIKEGQDASSDWRALWQDFCQLQNSTNQDPQKHSEVFLRQFLASNVHTFAEEQWLQSSKDVLMSMGINLESGEVRLLPDTPENPFVEEYINDNGFDENAAESLRGLSGEEQNAIMNKGPVKDYPNPSAVLLMRIKELADKKAAGTPPAGAAAGASAWGQPMVNKENQPQAFGAYGKGGPMIKQELGNGQYRAAPY